MLKKPKNSSQYPYILTAQEYTIMRSNHSTPHRVSGKGEESSKNTYYPPEESFNPEFVEAVERADQDIQNGKGMRFKTAEDLFAYLRK
jgi:hypothetical protein